MEISSEKVLYRQSVIKKYPILFIAAIVSFVLALAFLIVMGASLLAFNGLAQRGAQLEHNPALYAKYWEDFWSGMMVHLNTGNGSYRTMNCASFWVWFGLGVGFIGIGVILLIIFLLTRINTEIVLTDYRIISVIRFGKKSHEQNLELEDICSFNMTGSKDSKCGFVTMHTASGDISFYVSDSEFYDRFVEARNKIK